jgi:dihydrodipicolinate synthase/N-acetylneuraminate lyase
MDVHGVIVPSLTFFDENQKIINEIQSLLIKHLLLNGADAILLLSRFGEGLLFSEDIEQTYNLIDLTYEITGNKTPILLNILGDDEVNIISKLNEVGKKYPKLIFVLPPPIYKKLSFSQLISYFENILSSINIKNTLILNNNPFKFHENEITPEIVAKVREFSNVKGLIDDFENINYAKFYSSIMGDNFSIFCSKEGNFQKYFQIVPPEHHKISGIVPSISNLVNLCSKIYYCAIEEKLLELHQYQDDLNDLHLKIYDPKIDLGKVRRGLKYAFLSLYKDIISTPLKYNYNISPDLQRNLDDITMGRIDATINYLINQKYIYKLYSLGKKEIYQLNDVIKIFSDVKVLLDQGKIKKIIGPYTANFNTIYRVNFEKSKVLFRFRTSGYFRSEDMIKEKLIFPLLDGTISSREPNFRETIKPVLVSNKGDYIFKDDKPPIIPVGSLLYYDETKEKIPYNFSIQEYIHGKSSDEILGESMNLSKTKFLNLFNDVGDILGKLHSIEFNSFQETLYDIGKEKTANWIDIFKKQLNLEIQELRRNKFDIDKDLSTYFKEFESLMMNDQTPVLIHNDFQLTNIIAKEGSGKININGIIDFDDWSIGVKAQDFVKLHFFTFNVIKNPDILNSFLRGYKNHHIIEPDFNNQIELYTAFWLIRMLNYESLKKMTEKPLISRSSANNIAYYLEELKKIISN